MPKHLLDAAEEPDEHHVSVGLARPGPGEGPTKQVLDAVHREKGALMPVRQEPRPDRRKAAGLTHDGSSAASGSGGRHVSLGSGTSVRIKLKAVP